MTNYSVQINLNRIRKKIRASRKGLDLTLKDVGVTVGVTPQAIHHCEAKGNQSIMLYLQFLCTKGIDLNAIFKEEEY